MLPYLQYEVRVIAHNNLGASGPSWFTQVQYDPLLVNAVATANDYHNGSQVMTVMVVVMTLHVMT